MILDGRVFVNDRLVTELGRKVDPSSDRITVDGQLVSARPAAELKWVAVYKPKGYMCTCDDEKGRKTVLELVPGADRARLLPVGRLDRNTAGLLLMTNDNAWVNELTHPSKGFQKHYRVVVEGRPDDRTLTRLSDGSIHLADEDRPFAPCVVEWLADDDRRGGMVTTTLRLTLSEGRNRQIRRMMDAVHHPVYALTRTAIGPITLKGLAPGEWRELTAGEVNQLKRQRKQSGGGASSPRGGGEGRRRNFTPGRPRRQAMYDDGDDDHDDDHERRRSRKNSGRFGGWQQQQ
jgi:23S rRNA pseudouridine2605 synthase